MKHVATKAIWIGLVIIFILLGAVVVIIGMRMKASPYNSYPKTEARILKVENYQRRSDGSDTKYGSTLQVEYTVNGKQVQAWVTFDRDTSLQVGETLTVAYNPDHPSDCHAMNGKPDITRILALIAGIALVIWICKRTLTSHR